MVRESERSKRDQVSISFKGLRQDKHKMSADRGTLTKFLNQVWTTLVPGDTKLLGEMMRNANLPLGKSNQTRSRLNVWAPTVNLLFRRF